MFLVVKHRNFVQTQDWLREAFRWQHGVVGSASNGRIALQKVRELRPDLVTLDMEMPELDGLAVLDALFREGEPPVEVIVVSASSRRGGDLTMKALEGSFDERAYRSS